MAFDFGTINMEYAGHLATIPAHEDGPIFMVNYMRYKEIADYGDASGPAISGKEADDKYAPVDVLARIGAHVAYFGDVIAPDDDGAEVWHRMGIVCYPTRRSFIEMQTRTDFKEKVVHKGAGMDFSIVMGALPEGPLTGEPDGSGIVTFILHGADSAASSPTGTGATFRVEDVVIGDERRFSTLVMTWSAVDAGSVPEDALVVRAKTQIDNMRQLIDDSLKA
jgi:hypothetical protein